MRRTCTETGPIQCLAAPGPGAVLYTYPVVSQGHGWPGGPLAAVRMNHATEEWRRAADLDALTPAE